MIADSRQRPEQRTNPVGQIPTSGPGPDPAAPPAPVLGPPPGPAPPPVPVTIAPAPLEPPMPALPVPTVAPAVPSRARSDAGSEQAAIEMIAVEMYRC